MSPKLIKYLKRAVALYLMILGIDRIRVDLLQPNPRNPASYFEILIATAVILFFDYARQEKVLSKK